MELRRQCQKFAVDLLDQTRTSNELAIILNYDPEMSTYEPGDRMSLNRLEQAITYKQKKVGQWRVWLKKKLAKVKKKSMECLNLFTTYHF